VQVRHIDSECGACPGVVKRRVGAAGSSSPHKMVCDHLGSMRLVVKASGPSACQVVQRIDSDPFGVFLTDSDPHGSRSGALGASAMATRGW